VSDPTTPLLDPVEDRLRRTFEVRAEDMAPGDADEASAGLVVPAPVPAPGRSARSRRPLLAAAVVLLVTLVAAGVALASREDEGGGADRATTAGERSSAWAAEMATAPRALVEALQDERALATNRLRGTDEVIALEVADTAEARRITDVTLAVFETFVAPEGAAYAEGLAALEGLAQLRTDIDADPGPRDLDNLAASQAVFDRYAAMVDRLLDDQTAFAVTIDDPVVRAGAEAHGRGLQLVEQTTQLVESSIWAVVVPGPAVVTDVSRLHADLQHELDALVTGTAGTAYADAAATVVGEVEGSGLLDAATGLIEGGSLDLSVLFDGRDLLVGERWPAFLDRVEEILAAQG
jgi:hypothetical protein